MAKFRCRVAPGVTVGLKPCLYDVGCPTDKPDCKERYDRRRHSAIVAGALLCQQHLAFVPGCNNIKIFKFGPFTKEFMQEYEVVKTVIEEVD